MNDEQAKESDSERERFEEAAFNQRFLASIVAVKPGEFGPIGMPLGMSKDCPFKNDFVAKNADGGYVEESLNYAWWGWQKRSAQQPAESASCVLVPKEPTEDDRKRIVAQLLLQLWITLPQVPAGQMPNYEQAWAIASAVLAAAPRLPSP